MNKFKDFTFIKINMEALHANASYLPAKARATKVVISKEMENLYYNLFNPAHCFRRWQAGF